MPLLPDYSWKQNAQKIMLTLSLHGCKQADVDVNITSRHVKVRATIIYR